MFPVNTSTWANVSYYAGSSVEVVPVDGMIDLSFIAQYCSGLDYFNIFFYLVFIFMVFIKAYLLRTMRKDKEFRRTGKKAYDMLDKNFDFLIVFYSFIALVMTIWRAFG